MPNEIDDLDDLSRSEGPVGLGVYISGELQPGSGDVFLRGGDERVSSTRAATVLAANTIHIVDDLHGSRRGHVRRSMIDVYGTVSAPQTEIDGSPYGDTFNLGGVFYGDVSVQGVPGRATTPINVNPAGIEGLIDRERRRRQK